MPSNLSLPQELIRQSRILMSGRLLQIQSEIMRKFQYSKDKQLVRRMFYRNMDQLVTLQEKISYLLMVLEDIDCQRLNKYWVSAYCQSQLETDTSQVQYREGQQQERQRRMKNSLLSSPQRLSCKKNNNNNYSDNNLNKYYSQSCINPQQQTDQAIISTLYNSNQPHIYKDLINIHKSRKSQAQLTSTDSLINNQSIQHQIKRLSMQKQIQKYQYNSTLTNTLTNTYAQTYTQPIDKKINNYAIEERKSYQTDYERRNNDLLNQQQTYNNRDLLNRLQKKYSTTKPTQQKHQTYQQKDKLKENKTNIHKNNQYQTTNINDLFSFRPNQNLKNKNINKTQNINNKTQNNNNKKQQKLTNQPEINFHNNNTSHNKQQTLKYKSDTMSEQDQWLIQKLNKKIHDEDNLNSMLLNKRSSNESSHKQTGFMSLYGENMAKLQKLQEERFISQKQAQLKVNPFKQTIGDNELQQRLKGFKSWLKHQSVTNLSQSDRNNNNIFTNQMSNFKRLPKFKFFNTEKDLNQFGQYRDNKQSKLWDKIISKNELQYDKDKGYVCYSQSQLQSLGQLYDKGMRLSKQGIPKDKNNNHHNDKNNKVFNKYEDEVKKVFKKKPQLIITQMKNNNKNYQNINKSNSKSISKHKNQHKLSCNHSKSFSRSKSKSNTKVKQQLSKQNLNKIKQIEKIYSPKSNKKVSTKINTHKVNNKLSDYLPKQHLSKQNNNSNKICNNKKVFKDQQHSLQSSELNEQKINSRLLKRVKSSPYMINSQSPFSRQKQDYNQLIQRYRLDERRQHQIKNRILEGSQSQSQYQLQQNTNSNSNYYGTY